ncbi:MAG: hypothetical protein F6K31_23385 [Symploca sp. SIO2G7]|nr:hypothetical protein [Symploca sp. SIO2G7]
MSGLKSAYQAVALAVWQKLVQQYPEELVEENWDDLEELDEVNHADSNGQNLTRQPVGEKPVSSEQE